MREIKEIIICILQLENGYQFHLELNALVRNGKRPLSRMARNWINLIVPVKAWSLTLNNGVRI